VEYYRCFLRADSKYKQLAKDSMAWNKKNYPEIVRPRATSASSPSLYGSASVFLLQTALLQAEMLKKSTGDAKDDINTATKVAENAQNAAAEAASSDGPGTCMYNYFGDVLVKLDCLCCSLGRGGGCWRERRRCQRRQGQEGRSRGGRVCGGRGGGRGGGSGCSRRGRIWRG
jgi:hypothetical protein